MKKIITFTTCFCLVVLSGSCSKINTDTSSLSREDQNMLSVSDAKEYFSKALSKAVYEHREVRDLLKTEALKQFDNDYDVFYPYIKNTEISGLGTFSDIIKDNLGDPSILEKIEKALPTLTIYVSDVTWFDKDGFCAHNWDTKDSLVSVTYRNDKEICEKMFGGGEYIGDLPKESIPAGPVLIVKDNERVSASKGTRAGEIKYEFIDEVFDGSKNKETRSPRFTGDYSSMWYAGEKPGDSSPFMSTKLLNEINPDIIKSYEMFKNDRYALPNDYIYYGMTPDSTQGRLRADVRPAIIRFYIPAVSFDSVFDSPEDGTHVGWFDADDDGGRRAEPSFEDICNRLWADGKLEICFEVVKGSQGKTVLYDQRFFNVTPRDLYTLNDNSIRKEQWNSTWRKWYITWAYSIKDRGKALKEKWYYIYEKNNDNNFYLPAFDLNNISEYTIIVTERDPGTTVTKTYAVSTKNARKISANLNKGEDIKFGLGWDSSKEETIADTYSVTYKTGSDDLALNTISYRDKYIKNKRTDKDGYDLHVVSSGKFTYTILPCRYQ